MNDAQISINERICFVCGEKIPERKGVYHSFLRILICQGKCSEIVHSQERDYTSSARGRWRSRREVLDSLWKIRQRGSEQ